MRPMVRPRWPALLCLSALGVTLLGSGCELTMDLEHLDNGKCPAGEKLCNNQCISIRTPQVGCAQVGCVPCAPAHAIASCGPDGMCAIGSCVGRFQDCNGRPDDGCEIDIDHDPLHCGGCAASPCVVPNATPDCGGGTCAVRSCNDGFDDCNDDASDGCETNLLTSAANCSKCHMQCAAGGACHSGRCG